MSEKITSSQLYLFLANQKDWKTEADVNHNDEISKAEMRDFLSSSDFENWAGVSVKDISAKVFNEFWEKLDSNAHNNVLDEKELNRTLVQIEAVKEVKTFIDKKASDIPSGLENYTDLWNSELTNALNDVIINYINGISFSDTELTDAMKNEISTLLENAYADAKANAAVQCYIQKYTTENANSADIKALKEYGYLLTDDKDLERIVKSWVSENQETDPAKISDAVKNLIEGYLATAKIGSGDVSVLNGNSGYNASKLNELQMAKLKKEAQGIFGSSLKTVDLGFTIEGTNGEINLTGGGYDGIYKKYVDEFLKSYFESGYKNATCTDGQSLFEAALNELQTKGMQLFKDSKAGENFITEIQFADNYRYAWEGKDFFKEVVATGIDGVNENGGIVEGSDLANLKAWLNSDAGEAKFPEYYAAYNKILQSLLNPYDNTYRKNDGSINYDKINTELLEIVKTKFGIKTSSTSNEDGTTTTSIDTQINWSDLSDNKYTYTGYLITQDGDNNIQSNGNMSYFYNSGRKLNLLNGGGGSGYVKGDWQELRDVAKSNFAGFINSIKTACIGSGKYDSAAIEVATNKILTLYNMAFDGCTNAWAGKKDTQTNSFTFEGESYNYTVKKWYRESSAKTNSNDGGNLGLTFAESYAGDNTFQYSVDTKKVMDLFAKFYADALK